MTVLPRERHPRFRERLVHGPMLVAPGVYDGLSALVAQRVGAECLYLSGGAVARSTGIPDIGLIHAHQIAERLSEIVDATDLPVVVDGDTGHGGLLNVERTIRLFLKEGASAVHLEDQTFPKRCGHYANHKLVSANEMIGRIRAALAGRGDDDLVLIARTDAISAESFESAVQRARLYHRSGADAIFVEAPQTIDQIERLPQELDGIPLILNMFRGGKTPYIDRDRASEAGFKLMIVPSDLQRAAIRAMETACRSLIADGVSLPDESMVDFNERDAIVGLNESLARLEEFELKAVQELAP